MKRVFIVNPKSGSGEGILLSNMIKEICESKKYEYDIHYTKYPNHATEIAQLYSNEKEPVIVYSIGGDGTLNEVVNGIVGSNNFLAVIPAGTGNDFVKSLKKGIYSVDLGQVNDRYFINTASVGLDAQVCANLQGLRKLPIRPKDRYLFSILYTFLTYNYLDVCYKKDKEIKKKITLIAICNGRYYGGKYGIAPTAKLDDGLFDIYVADYIPKTKIPKLFKKLEEQTHMESPYVSVMTSSYLTITSKKSLYCGIDGELIKGKHFEFKIHPKAIKIYNKDDLKIEKYFKKRNFN